MREVPEDVKTVTGDDDDKTSIFADVHRQLIVVGAGVPKDATEAVN